MSEQLIEQYMRELAEQAAACSAACAEADKEIEKLQHQLEIKTQARNKLAEPFEVKSAELREKIESLVLVSAESFKCTYGTATFRKAGIRRVWDLDALDAVCTANTEVKEKIWSFRDPKPFPASVTIKLKELPKVQSPSQTTVSPAPRIDTPVTDTPVTTEPKAP